MTEQKHLSPKNLWNSLLDLDPKKFDGAMPDIDMLRAAFKKQPKREESTTAKNVFETAINNWNDSQIREFIWFISEQKLPAEITSAQLHSTLKMLYQEIFEK